MIKIKEIEVFNFKGALRGMRNPLESWDKSDSYFSNNQNIIGEKDLALALKLVKAGTDHSKFLRQIFVSMDITAPEYWWKEYETYQVGTTENSTSTMHKITSRLLNENDFSFEDCQDRDFVNTQISYINKLIKKYQSLLAQKKYEFAKQVWRELIQFLTMSFNYLRTCTLNYQVLRNMYFARKNHKLSEWIEFCKIIKTLPYSELITIEGSK